MEQLYQTYQDIAAVYIVYISEAHAADDKYPVHYAKKKGIREHTSFGERCGVAARLVADKKLTIPCLVDNMDNAAEKAYRGWPDRVFLIRKDGTLAVAGNRGPWGFKPGLDAAADWLAKYKETNVEPPPVHLKDTKVQYRKTVGQMNEAFEAGDLERALEYALEAHTLFPDDYITTYNIACIQCLLGNREAAYTWIEKAISAGYDDADELASDDDFKSIRAHQRFKDLVARLKN